MKWSFKLGTVAGTEVRVHVTFFILLAFVALQGMSGGQGTAGALDAVLFVTAAFVCVLLHEFGHVTAARGFGIRTPDITLLPIGGVARLERMPEKPAQELVVALCGPLVNVVIAAGLSLFLGLGIAWNPELFEAGGHFWEKLMIWNLMMVAFNLVPAFPMDGGRVLRALLGLVVDYERATRWAAALGQTIAVTAGLLMLLSGQASPVLLLIAFFVFMAAGQEAAMVSQRQMFHGLRVQDAMITDFRAVAPDALLRDVVALLLSGTQHDFPVLGPHGDLLGIITRQRLVGALSEHGPVHPVGGVLEPLDVQVPPRMDLVEALGVLDAATRPTLPVIDPLTGRCIGLLNAENVGELLMVRTALKRA
ncbi:MAG: putative zinc metalloprotease Rip3 [Prosthecobacter sp.]|nr:putative zinc metalloprotease Rip3 [Prosthecobacter sp.]